jgi:hypothetical protein
MEEIFVFQNCKEFFLTEKDPLQMHLLGSPTTILKCIQVLFTFLSKVVFFPLSIQQIQKDNFTFLF